METKIYKIVEPSGRVLAQASSAADAKVKLEAWRGEVRFPTVMRGHMIVTSAELDELCEAEARGAI